MFEYNRENALEAAGGQGLPGAHQLDLRGHGGYLAKQQEEQERLSAYLLWYPQHGASFRKAFTPAGGGVGAQVPAPSPCRNSEKGDQPFEAFPPSTRRSYHMSGPNPIAISEIEAYCRFLQIESAGTVDGFCTLCGVWIRPHLLPGADKAAALAAASSESAAAAAQAESAGAEGLRARPGSFNMVALLRLGPLHRLTLAGTRWTLISSWTRWRHRRRRRGAADA